MEKIPAPGDLYRSLTDKIYQVIAVAVHAQSGEQMVVYQAMFGDYSVFTMPLAAFAGEKNEEKHSGLSREYIFEKIERTGLSHQKAEPEDMGVQNPLEEGVSVQNPAEAGICAQDTAKPGPYVRRPADSKRAFSQNPAEAAADSVYGEKRRRQIEEREQRRGLFRKPEKHETATEELRANPCLLKFLEADTYEERFHVLNQIQDEITDRLIDDIAVVLDVVIPEGALNDRFHQLRDVILTRQKYETSRFR